MREAREAHLLVRIRELVENGRYRIGPHVEWHMMEEGFDKEHCVGAVLGGRLLESYPGQNRHLVAGRFHISERNTCPLHVVCEIVTEPLPTAPPPQPSTRPPATPVRRSQPPARPSLLAEPPQDKGLTHRMALPLDIIAARHREREEAQAAAIAQGAEKEHDAAVSATSSAPNVSGKGTRGEAAVVRFITAYIPRPPDWVSPHVRAQRKSPSPRSPR
jgi:hypothetical protein